MEWKGRDLYVLGHSSLTKPELGSYLGFVLGVRPSKINNLGRVRKNVRRTRTQRSKRLYLSSKRFLIRFKVSRDDRAQVDK